MAKFSSWNIPFASLPFKSREIELRTCWRDAAQKNILTSSLSKSRIDILTKAYWKVNIHKQFVSTKVFIKDLISAAQNRYPVPCLQPRQDLVALLAQIFALQTHAFTDIMNFSPLFEDWTSINESDIPFGAKLWNTTSLHSGTNSFFFQPPNSQIKIDGLMEILSETLQTSVPSRFVCLLPKAEKLPSQFLELAIFNSSAPILTSGNLTLTPVTMSLILAMNKESMLVDPINWNLFKSRLIKLSGNWSPGLLLIPQQTDALFNERSSLPHPPRAVSKHPINVLLRSSSIINFFDAYAPRTPCRPINLPPRAADLIRQMNRHPTFLGVLGILPNQFRTLLKETGHDFREEFLLDLSQTLFLAGFRVWKKRQQLASRYWNEVGQRQKKGNVKQKKRKRNNKEEKMTESKCQNPFHYLRRHSNFSKQRPTKCPCRNVLDFKSTYVNQPITKFTRKIPRNIVFDTDPRTESLKKKPDLLSQDKLFMTRTDAIRKEHDRSKKRPLKQLTLNLTTTKKKQKN